MLSTYRMRRCAMCVCVYNRGTPGISDPLGKTAIKSVLVVAGCSTKYQIEVWTIFYQNHSNNINCTLVNYIKISFKKDDEISLYRAKMTQDSGISDPPSFLVMYRKNTIKRRCFYSWDASAGDFLQLGTKFVVFIPTGAKKTQNELQKYFLALVSTPHTVSLVNVSFSVNSRVFMSFWPWFTLNSH